MADSVEVNYTRLMGPELGVVFYQLWNECAWLHCEWQEYVTLFGTKPERIELMNASAPLFFYVVRCDLFEAVLLQLCRLTDRPQSPGKVKMTNQKTNLSVQQLTGMLNQAVPNFPRLMAECLSKCDFARDWRDRHIAHRDLELALKKAPAPLATATRKKVSEAIESIAALLNEVQRHYGGGVTRFDIGFDPGTAESLLFWVREGLEAERRRIERIKSGHYDPSDFGPRDPL